MIYSPSWLQYSLNINKYPILSFIVKNIYIPKTYSLEINIKYIFE